LPSEGSRDKNLLVDIWLISTLTAQLVDEALVGTPLSTDEFALYGLIVDLAPVTAADLARATGMRATTLSGILGRCEQRGELTRIPKPADRRSSLLELTPAGMAIYRELVPRLRALLARLDAALERRSADVRLHLQALDDALRGVRGVGPRPYRLASRPARRLEYHGTALSARQQREVLDFIDWLRHRDAHGAAGPAGP
jgi:DNA-binding MarR family transcriptional regulator